MFQKNQSDYLRKNLELHLVLKESNGEILGPKITCLNAIDTLLYFVNYIQLDTTLSINVLIRQTFSKTLKPSYYYNIFVKHQTWIYLIQKNAQTCGWLLSFKSL